MSDPAARFYLALGAKIRAARTESGLSQLALGRTLGLERSAIANIENGNQRLLPHYLPLLMQALQVTLLQLLPGPETLAAAGRISISDDQLAGLPLETRAFIANVLSRVNGDTSQERPCDDSHVEKV